MNDLIKRSEAITEIKEYANNHTFNSFYKGMLKACEILVQLPSADRPQGDSVSRRYLLAEIDDLADEFSEVDENGLHSERWCGILDSKGIIVNAPSVPDRPQAEWIRRSYWSEGIGMGESYGFYYECSNCGGCVRGGYYECVMKFCPNCGMKMKGAKNERI